MIPSLQCQTLILKTVSVCNLNCSYCYMYNLGDATYKSQPKVMSPETVDAILERVLRHSQHHGLKEYEFIFHGGEPLLARPDFYAHFLAKAQKRLSPFLKLRFGLQTNATLLTKPWCQFLSQYKIRLSISLDGLPSNHDTYRQDHAGRGSYHRVEAGIRLAQQHYRYPLSLLSVINCQADAELTYSHLASLGISEIDFALPDAHHNLLPLGLSSAQELAQAPFGRWLIQVFEAWWNQPSPRPNVRLFDQIMGLIAGIDNGFEYFGQRRNEFLIVETDGSLEAVGTLKACGSGFTKAGVNIQTHEIDEALQTPLATLYQLSHQRSCQACQNCHLYAVCGGGYLPHRYSESRGFDNPSVYCQDLQMLITHIQHRLLLQLPASFRKRSGLELLPLPGALPNSTDYQADYGLQSFARN